MVAIENVVWLFGGTANYQTGSNDLFSLDVAFAVSLQWTVHSVTGAPSPRFGHGMAVSGSLVYVYGGRNSEESAPLGDMWSLDTAHQPPKWAVVPTYADAGAGSPGGRAGFGFASASNRFLFLVGGEGGEGRGLMRADLAEAVPVYWETATPSGGTPAGMERVQHGMVLAGNALVLAGGAWGVGGKWMETWRAQMASQCLAGAYGEEEETRACTACPPGTFSGAGATACAQCGPDRYLVSAREGCEACPKGTFAGAGALKVEECVARAEPGGGAVTKMALELVVEVGGVSREGFEGVRGEFEAACAQAGGVSAGDVRIPADGVREVPVEAGGGSPGVEVTAIIAVLSTTIDAVKRGIQADLVSVAAARGLPPLTLVRMRAVNVTESQVPNIAAVGGFPTGAVIGGVVGGSAAIAMCAWGIYYRRARKKWEEMRLRRNMMVIEGAGWGPKVRKENLGAFGGAGNEPHHRANGGGGVGEGSGDEEDEGGGVGGLGLEGVRVDVQGEGEGELGSWGEGAREEGEGKEGKEGEEGEGEGVVGGAAAAAVPSSRWPRCQTFDSVIP